MQSVWSRGKESIHKERLELETYMSTHSDSNNTSTIEPWDWRFYAEKVRQSQYDLDEEEVKPYFSLERMLEAIFDVAGKLFGLSFTLR
jgi:peptidyl-dipeptidase Dcp